MVRRIIDLSLELAPSPPDFLEKPERYLPSRLLDVTSMLYRTEIFPIVRTDWESTKRMDRRRAHRLCTSLHACTHIETPAVTIRDGKFIHEYTLGSFVAKACVMNFAHKEAASEITLEDVKEQWVDGCKGIIIRTDWAKRRGINDVFTETSEEDVKLAPKFTVEVINWIIAEKPKLYVDDFEGLCPKPPGELKLFESGLCRIHRAINIDKIQKKVVTLIALPLKIGKTNTGVGVEATPTRAIAIEED